MARQLDEEIALRLKSKLEEAGVSVYLNTSIKEIIGDSEVSGIVTDHTTISCDTILYSIGVIPNIEIVKNTSIAVNRGIIVNDKMETNIEHVYAAGDVAEWNGEVAGLWQPAMDQGKVAGGNMASQSEVYEKTIPVTLFNAFDVMLFSIGLVDENQCDTTIVEVDSEKKYTRIFIKNQKLVGVISQEGAVASILYKSAIENNTSLANIDFENLSITEMMNQLKEIQKKSA